MTTDKKTETGKMKTAITKTEIVTTKTVIMKTETKTDNNNSFKKDWQIPVLFP